jgi:integrase
MVIHRNDPGLLTHAYPLLTPTWHSVEPMKLTKRTIDTAKPNPNVDTYFWDDEVPGFGLRIKPSGVRSFIVQYRNSSTVSRRITLGKFGVLTPEQARRIAKQTLADVARGSDPAEKRAQDRKAMTVRQLCQAYLEAVEKGLVLGKGKRPKKPSTLYIDRGRIERHILPLLGSRRVRDLTPPDIVRFMRDVSAGKTADDIKTGFRGRAIVKGGAGTASRTVGLLGGIMSFAVSEGVIPTNPVRGVKRPADNRREIRLTAEQYQTLGSALEKAIAGGESSAAILGVRLLALTGCRRGEIERLRWDEVDLPGRCLRLSDSKEGKSIRPLGRDVAILLDKLPRDGRYVLNGSAPEKPFAGLPKAWARIVGKAELPGFTPHGLRHAFASVAADLGYAEPTIASMLGHATRSITGRYVHHLDSTLIAAADKVAGQIAAMMAGRRTSAKVVPLRTAAIG